MTKGKRLIATAVALLDSGGENAVTLRAVGHDSDVSHNAPYKHFKSRDALRRCVRTHRLLAVMETAAATGKRQMSLYGKKLLC